MTTLSDIRQIETRLHSHLLEWSDVPLQNELLYLLDDLQELHNELDKRDVPNTDAQGIELNLRQRIRLLVTRQKAEQVHLDFYARPVQSNLF